MLKFPIRLILVLMLVQRIFAQGNYEVFHLSEDAVVNTKNIPAGFKFFVPDLTSQTFVNPARGFFSYGKFIYATYYLGAAAANNPDLPNYSISYFNKDWLLRFEAFNRFDDSENNTIVNSNQNQSLSKRNDLTKDDDLNLRLLLVDVGETINYSYAIGFTGILGIKKYSRFVDSESVTTTVINDEFGNVTIREFNATRNSDQSADNTGYLLGFNLDLAGRDWDWINSLNFQRLNLTDEAVYQRFQGVYDPLTESREASLLFFDKIEENYKIKQSPGILNLKSYFRVQGAFFNTVLSYAFDTPVNFSLENIVAQRESPDSEDSRSEIRDSGTRNTPFFESEFSAGYVFSKSINNLNFFTGISPDVSYRLTENVGNEIVGDSPAAQFFIRKDQRLQTAIVAPVYLNYNANLWLSVFGGLNYFLKYEYSYYKIQDTGTAPEIDTVRKIERTQKRLSTEKNIYVGVSVRHGSGLVAHVDFNGDFGRVDNWNVSLGYNF